MKRCLLLGLEYIMSSCEPASEIGSGDWNDYKAEIGMITKKQDSNWPNVIKIAMGRIS